jgi:hypothetical protein
MDRSTLVDLSASATNAHQFKQANFHFRQECMHNSSLMTKFGDIIGSASSEAERKETFFAKKYLQYDELKAEAWTVQQIAWWNGFREGAFGAWISGSQG